MTHAAPVPHLTRTHGATHACIHGSSSSAAVQRRLSNIQTALTRHGYYFSFELDLSDAAPAAAHTQALVRDGACSGGGTKESGASLGWNKNMLQELDALASPACRHWAPTLVHGAVHTYSLPLATVAILARRRCMQCLAIRLPR